MQLHMPAEPFGVWTFWSMDPLEYGPVMDLLEDGPGIWTQSLICDTGDSVPLPLQKDTLLVFLPLHKYTLLVYDNLLIINYIVV